MKNENVLLPEKSLSKKPKCKQFVCDCLSVYYKVSFNIVVQNFIISYIYYSNSLLTWPSNS